MEIKNIKKRDGRVVEFEPDKIVKAIMSAVKSVGGTDTDTAEKLADSVVDLLIQSENEVPEVEEVQDIVEKVLIEAGHAKTAKAYILFRHERDRARNMNNRLMKSYEQLTFGSSTDVEVKRENANIDGDTAMGTMLKYGSEGAKMFNLETIVSPEFSIAHKSGDIHIHDLDFLTLTTTCCQLPIDKLFEHGFNTGHGHLREPSEIRSYSALAAISIQANQNDQHGGQSIPAFDYYLAVGVAKTFIKSVIKVLKCRDIKRQEREQIEDIYKELKKYRQEHKLIMNSKGYEFTSELMQSKLSSMDNEELQGIIQAAIEETDVETHQAMEAFVHNLNTMHSRAGAQVPFSSINLGTDTSEEGRLITKHLLLAMEEGLGYGETAIFPIVIFKEKSGVSYNPEDPNYDLWKLACKVSAKRLFPNFSNLDVEFNRKYLKDNNPNTEAAYMGCRTRVIGNVYDPTQEIVTGRGNLSFTTINLPRLAILAKGNQEEFFQLLKDKLKFVGDQLYERYTIQCRKTPRNYPFLMGQGVWLDSDKLNIDDSISEVLRHGTLSLGFIGLAEALILLLGNHHGESEEAQNLGLEIVKTMREYTDKRSIDERMNYTLLATPAESLAGRFLRIDRRQYGIIEGVTDKEFYTNSFHVPVYYDISAFKKIDLEAPYHELTNAGHITYIELDGDPTKNLEAFETVVRYMHDAGVGYGAINHPIDRDPVCGYTGIIEDVCPRCGRKDGEGISKERMEELKKMYRDLPESYYYGKY